MCIRDRDKVGYVWLAISIDPVYIDTGNWIESAAGLCYECLNDIALDVFGMTGNDQDVYKRQTL